MYRIKIKGLTLATYNHSKMKEFYSNVFEVDFTEVQHSGYTLYQEKFGDLDLLLCPAELVNNQTNQNRHQFDILVESMEEVMDKTTLNDGKVDGIIEKIENVRSIAIYDPDNNSIVIHEV